MKRDVGLLADANPLFDEAHWEIDMDHRVGLLIDPHGTGAYGPVDSVSFRDLLANSGVIQVVPVQCHLHLAGCDAFLDSSCRPTRNDMNPVNVRIGQGSLEDSVTRSTARAEDCDSRVARRSILEYSHETVVHRQHDCGRKVCQCKYSQWCKQYCTKARKSHTGSVSIMTGNVRIVGSLDKTK